MRNFSVDSRNPCVKYDDCKSLFFNIRVTRVTRVTRARTRERNHYAGYADQCFQ